MKIKVEPLDDEDLEQPKPNLIYILQPFIGNTAVKLDSCTLNEASTESKNSDNLQITSQSANLPVVPIVSHIVPVVSSHTSSLPASENWPGKFNFTVSFSPQNKDTKGISWTYSAMKDKLYVGKDVPCPINFSVNTLMPQDEVTIRAMALYSSPEQVSEIVRRCVNHSMEEINNGLTEAEHLVRCESSAAVYLNDSATGRHSVTVPFENPAVGQHYSTYIYKFACFGSCSGGPNRRPLMLIFTLEKGNQVIGRRKIDVKICACPGRDRKTDEAQCMPDVDQPRPVKRKAQSELVNLSEVMDFSKQVYLPPPKKSKASPNENGNFILEVEDKGCFDFLRQMKNFYELCKFMKNVSPDLITKAKYFFPKTDKNT